MSRFNTGNPLGSGDPRDLDDNAKNLDEAANSPADTFQDRLGKSRLTWAGIVKSGTGDAGVIVPVVQQAVQDVVAGVDGQVAVAQSAADRAEAARDAAIINSEVFPDEETGRAAVADGEYFKVIGSGEVAAREYKRLNASTSVLITEYPSSEAHFKNNPAFVPKTRDGVISDLPDYMRRSIIDARVYGAREGNIYSITYFGNGYPFESGDPETDYMIIQEFTDDWVFVKTVVARSQKLNIDRALDSQTIRIYGYRDESIYFDITLNPSQFRQWTQPMTAGSSSSWIIDPKNYYANPADIDKRLLGINERLWKNDLARLSDALADPLHSVKIKLIGDSITWGSGASGMAPSEPRNWELADPRNNYTSRSWANVLRDFLGKTYLAAPVLKQQDTIYHTAPEFSGHACYESDVLVDVLQNDKVRFVSRENGSEYGKSSLAKLSRQNAIFGYSIPISVSQNNNALVEVDLTSDNLTIVFTFTRSEPVDGFSIYIYDKKTGATLGTINPSVSSQSQTHDINFDFGKRTIVIDATTFEGSPHFELEALKMNRKIFVNNDGINGTNPNHWMVISNLLEQSLESSDEFVLIQLGTNSRGSQIFEQESNLYSFEYMYRDMIAMARSVTGHGPFVMCANSVTVDEPRPGVENAFSMIDIYGVLKKIAEDEHLTFIDNFSVTGLLKSEGESFTNDGLHPNDAGHRVIAENIIRRLINRI